MADNIEKFILGLGFDDKEAIKDFKNLVQEMDKSLKKVKAEESKQADKVHKEKLKQQKKEAADKTSALKGQAQKQKMVDAMSEELRRDVKKDLKTKAQMEAAENQKRIKRQKEFNSAERAAYKEKLAREKKLTAEAKKRSDLISKFRHSQNVNRVGQSDPKRASNLVSRYKSAVTRGDVDLMNSLARESSNVAAGLRRQERKTLSLKTAQRGLNDSTRSLIRSFVSVYALYEGSNAINQTGQAFESLNSSMLAAMGNQEDATAQMEKLDKLTSRLGLSLIDTGEQYSKFIFASKGKLPTEDVDLLFEGMAELGTTLGVSKDRMKLSFTAIQQMMNKGTITSEELKRQLAESLPGAIQIFARSIGKSEAELFKMMENGELLASDVLPKVAVEMKKVANSGGALELKYKTTRVAQGKFFKELETGRKKIFDSGFDEGLAGVFNSMSDGIKESSEGLKGLGKIYQLFFTVVRNLSKILIPILDSIFFSLGKIAEGFTYIFDSKLGVILTGITAITVAMMKLSAISSVLDKIWKSLLLKITFAFGILDEIFSFFDENRTNVIEGLWGMQTGEMIDKRKEELATKGGRVGGTYMKPLGVPLNPEESKKPVIHNHIYVEGIKKSYEDYMTVEASSAYAGGRN